MIDWDFKINKRHIFPELFLILVVSGILLIFLSLFFFKSYSTVLH